MKPLRRTEMRLLDLHPPEYRFREDVLEGCAKTRKSLPCKYFYDERGSRLFTEICDLPEYYPTRIELMLMQEHTPRMAELLGPRCRLVEFGSGSSMKTRHLLDALLEPAAYVPVDIHRGSLEESYASLAPEYPDLEILPVCADFAQKIPLPKPAIEARRTVVYFPGSTIGNFDPEGATVLLKHIASLCGPNGALLLGADLKKEPSVLHRAYNDRRGITAAFNLNLLARINRELDADFQVDRFRHYAFFNPTHGRIEMHLQSVVDQVVHIAGERFEFARGESILTEYSHKYNPTDIAALAEASGFRTSDSWIDPRQNFGVFFLEVSA